MTCANCHRPLRPRRHALETAPGTLEHHGRGLCNTCWKRHHDDYDPAVRTRDELLAEVEYLTAGRLTPEQIADRLGVRVGSIARAAYRAGRLDIARTYSRADRLATRPGVTS